MLFLTAYGTPEDRIHGLELGADDYVTKPFVFRELLLRIQNMLKRARRPCSSAARRRQGRCASAWPTWTSAASPRRVGGTAAPAHPQGMRGAEAAASNARASAVSARRDPRPRLGAGRIPDRSAPSTISSCACASWSNATLPIRRTILSIRGVGYQLETDHDRNRCSPPPSTPQHRPPARVDDAPGRPLPLALPVAEALHRLHPAVQGSRSSPRRPRWVPIHDFNFDAAILFSDLLFPLEAMGMGLRYDPGPKLDFHLRTPADVARLKGGAAAGAAACSSRPTRCA